MENPLKVSLENIIPLTEARDHFSQIVNEVQKDKLYILTKGGKPAVAIVDVKYLEHITGGEAKVEHVQEEIKKAPEKVGLPPMVEHSMEKPAPPPIVPAPKVDPPKPTTPLSTPPQKELPKPAGFAAPQPPQPKPAPPKPPSPGPANGPEPLKTPAPDGGEKIDVQFTQEPPENKTQAKNTFASPDDKNPPAQYGGSDKEPEDMALD